MKLYVDGEELEASVGGSVVWAGDRLQVSTAEGVRSALAVRQGDTVLVSYLGSQFTVALSKPRERAQAAAGTGEHRAPMPGQVVDVRAKAGDVVKKGQVLVVLEAMKTQQPFSAAFDGVVEALPVSVGQLVAEGALLVKVVDG